MGGLLGRWEHLGLAWSTFIHHLFCLHRQRAVQVSVLPAIGVSKRTHVCVEILLLTSTELGSYIFHSNLSHIFSTMMTKWFILS